MTKLL